MKEAEKYPEKYTDEEEVLLQKYTLLKKMKKQLADLRSRQATDAEAREKEETPLKPTEDAKVAAERLVKSGKIKIHSASKSKIIIKKGKDAAEKSVPYKPYSPTHVSSAVGESAPEFINEEPTTPQAKRPRVNLYDSFVAAGREAGESGQAAAGDPQQQQQQQRRGNTLFVQGYGINQEMLRQAFAGYGPILKINMETRGKFQEFNPAPKAFVTFEEAEHAARVIDELDGQLVLGSVLNVKLARKQPNIVGKQQQQLRDWAQQQQQQDPTGGSSSPHYAPDAPPATVDAPPPQPLQQQQQQQQQQKPEHPEEQVSPEAQETASAAAAAERQPVQYSDDLFSAADSVGDEAVIPELPEVM